MINFQHDRSRADGTLSTDVNHDNPSVAEPHTISQGNLFCQAEQMFHCFFGALKVWHGA
jgi:hypothetical protein